jgi:hypothetical protein
MADSTVYFLNTSETLTERTVYEWDFGDGSPAVTTKHAYHTFPAFDSAYIVCMTATNACSSYTFCDTVFVDSSGLPMGIYGKKGNTAAAMIEQLEASQLPPGKTDESRMSGNVPNPFSEETIVQYSLAESVQQAEIRVTDLLGRLVQRFPLTHPRGLVLISAAQLHEGLYYYTLVTDGTVVDSKRMLVGK